MSPNISTVTQSHWREVLSTRHFHESEIVWVDKEGHAALNRNALP